jgi:PAS domain S-box-containing protein
MEWCDQSGRYQTFFIFVLLFFSLVLTYYFHFVLKTGIIFTHFFYIPIVLSAIWWKRKGLLVAIFLAVILLASDIIYPLKADSLVEDLIRMVIFISVSIIVVILSERIDKSHQKLEASEEKYRSVVQSAVEAIITVNSQGNIISWNKEAEKMFGYGEGEIMGESVTMLIPSRFVADFNKSMETFINSQQDKFTMGTELMGLRKDGNEFPLSASGSVWESASEKFFTTMIRDLSETRKAEELSANLAAIVENSSDAIVGKNLEGIVQSWNTGAENVYGYSAQEMIGKSISRLFPPDSDELDQILSTVSDGKSIKNYETKRITKDREEIDISLTSSPIKDHDENIIGASSISRDISKQKRAERSLKRNEAQLRLLTNNMADVICRASNEAIYLYVSPSVRQVYGFEPREMIGMSMLDFIHPEDVDKVTTCMKSAMQDCTPHNV